jgi:hypothetical protein
VVEKAGKFINGLVFLNIKNANNNKQHLKNMNFIREIFQREKMACKESPVLYIGKAWGMMNLVFLAVAIIIIIIRAFSQL